MIKPKKKPCKGTGIAKGYGCGKPTEYRAYGLGKMCCYADWLLNSENGKIKLEKAKLKATKPRKDLENYKEEKKERETLSKLLQNAVFYCHKYIRLRDKNKPCISCGTPYKSDFDAGHYFSAAKYSTLKFNEYNINGQCIQCNRFKEGNELEYSINLPNRIGQENFDDLKYLASQDKKTDFKWDRQKLKETIKYYKKKIRELNN